MNAIKRTYKTALVMCLADACGSPRPNRIIKLLNDCKISVDLLAFPSNGTNANLSIRQKFNITKPSSTLYVEAFRFSLNIPARVLKMLGLTRLAESAYEIRSGLGKIDKSLPAGNYDLIVVEDLQLLPFAFRRFGINNQTRIIFDAREFYTRQKEDELLFRLLEKPNRTSLCRNYLHRCDHLLTVSPGLADEYMKEFGVTMHILRSTPYFHSMNVTPTRRDKIKMVYHGMAHPNRGISNMIKILRRLDNRFTLDFYLVGNQPHIKYLKNQAEGCDRISFCDPVPYDGIIPMLNRYDIGFYYLEPTGFNVTYNLPNKFFEFIQGRLAIAIGPSHDMAELVRKHEIGFVSPEFTIDSMVETLAKLSSEKIDRAKIKSDIAAKTLCYESESLELTEKLNLRFS